MKRKLAGYQPTTVFLLLLLITFLIIPHGLIPHKSKQSPNSEEVICCNECHPTSCCKLKKRVEVMSACCSIGLHLEITATPKITIEENVDGNILHLTPPTNLPISDLNTFDIYSPEVLVPPPR